MKSPRSASPPAISSQNNPTLFMPLKISILLAVLGAVAVAQQPLFDEETVQQVRAELLVVRLPAAKAMALQKELRDPRTIQLGIGKLLALVAKDEAELVDWPSLTTRSRQRAVAENFREVRYPIEYEFRVEIPAGSVGSEGVFVPAPTAPTPGEGAGTQPPPGEKRPAKAPAGKAPPKPAEAKIAAGPTTFETKNVGVSLEVDPSVSADGTTVDLLVAAMHTSLLGYRFEKHKNEVPVEVPDFDVQKTQTNVTLKNGEVQLLGFYQLKEPKKTVELHILTATIFGPKLKSPTPPRRRRRTVNEGRDERARRTMTSRDSNPLSMKTPLLCLLLSVPAFAEEVPRAFSLPNVPVSEERKPSLNSPQPAKPAPLPTEEFLAQELQKIGKENADGKAENVANDWKVHWELHVFALPAKKALSLLPELRDEATIAAGWDKLQAMVEKDEADVVATNGGQVMNGVEMVSSQGEDLKYGIEFDAPKLIESSDAARQANQQTEPHKIAENLAVSFPTSTFETKRLGIALVMTARASDDGKRLEITTKFDRTWLVQWDETEVGRLPNNEKLLIKQPRIETVGNQGTSGLFAGERILLSSHRVPGNGGKMELVFLRVWTTPRKLPHNK
jgi:hypothetical protein